MSPTSIFKDRSLVPKTRPIQREYAIEASLRLRSNSALSSQPSRFLGDENNLLNWFSMFDALHDRRRHYEIPLGPTGSSNSSTIFRQDCSAPAWNGWGVDNANTRFQPGKAAGLTTGQVSSLKLKWAFGVPARRPCTSSRRSSMARCSSARTRAWCIVGALLEAGKGNLCATDFQALLCCDRRPRFATAPSKGLLLVSVEY